MAMKSVIVKVERCFSHLRSRSGVLILPALIFFGQAAYAAPENGSGLQWDKIGISLLGGLAFFLYGMEKMSQGMKETAGNKMRSILSALTKNRLIALLIGAFVTTVIQSSSATTVMLVGFVNAGLMTFSQTLGVILGAGIGTTITAQLIAFKLTDYALLLVVCGFAMQLVSKQDHLKNIGNILLGFGILFYGMKLMSDAMIPLREYDRFIMVLRELENPLVGIVIGTAFTALIQSSSAFVGIIIVLSQQGLIGLSAGIPLVFGANIGTCVTAIIAAVGASREAKQVVAAHVLFKVAGALVFLWWLPEFETLVRVSALKLGGDITRQIANAHTIFNIAIACCFLPFVSIFAKLITFFIPIREKEDDYQVRTWYLDENSIAIPALAIDLARTEMSRMAKLLGRMLRAIIIPFMSDETMVRKENLQKDEIELLVNEIPTRDEIYPSLSLLEGIDLREEKIDYLEEKISDYLLRIAAHKLNDDQISEVYKMISIVKDMESIGDIIHRNMVPLIDKKKKLGMDFSREGKEELMIYHHKVSKQVALLQEALKERDADRADKIMLKERKYLDLEYQYRVMHLERILCKREESVATHEIHMELMDLMKQVVVYSSNIAKTFLSLAEKKPSEGDGEKRREAVEQDGDRITG